MVVPIASLNASTTTTAQASTTMNINHNITPGYRYALEEFGMTVLPGTSNDDGVSILMGMVPSSSSSSSLTMNPRPAHTTTTSPANETLDIRTTDPCRLYIPPGDKDYEETDDEQDMIMYEEVYGEAYISGTLKYIYPVGYGSMRPRSCPWKLSIIVCLSFTWLSIFIVGHCSDRINNYNINNNASQDPVDDDILELDIRWCGSRLLYCLWVMSMLITGLSAGYCGIIGYIKVRDFAVANARSLPPKISKSDYYYYQQQQQHYRNIDDPEEYNHSSAGSRRRNSGNTSSGSSVINIYQSDGNPLFWGSYIYRPTQAAVAVTSR
jgi:hypothetical protein